MNTYNLNVVNNNQFGFQTYSESSDSNTSQSSPRMNINYHNTRNTMN